MSAAEPGAPTERLVAVEREVAGGREVAVEREVAVSDWHAAVAAARDEGFDFFDWLTAVDQSDAEARGDGIAGLDLVCHLLDSSSRGALSAVLLRTRVPLSSTRQPDAVANQGVGLSVPAGPAVASVTDLYAGAAWHERETHEMFGIEFTGFEDGSGLGLRPLLLPNGFEGTPLRKSFVLAARASKPWPGAKEPGESDADIASDGVPAAAAEAPAGADTPAAAAAAAAARSAGPATRRPGRRRVQPPGVPDPSWGPR